MENSSKQRELTGHRVNPANDRLTIVVLDGPGDGGACHAYQINGFDGSRNASQPEGTPEAAVNIVFQNGPIPEKGVNGVTHEALLAILIDRLEGFQRGRFACDGNAAALWNLENAQRALLGRTRERMARGVEGTHKT